jgi:hypothetical protein
MLPVEISCGHVQFSVSRFVNHRITPYIQIMRIRHLFLAVFLTGTIVAQPKLQITPQKLIDLGDLYTGQEIMQTITLHNTGDSLLRITGIQTTCGCTVALLAQSDSTLRPSDSTHVAIVYNTGSSTGNVAKAVTIWSTDPASPRQMVQISGFVIDRLALNPPILTYNLAAPDTIFRSRVLIRNQMKGHTLRIHTITTDLSDMAFVLSSDSLKPGEQGQLDVTFRPVADTSSRDFINLRLDNETEPSYKIPVLVRGK